MSPEFASSTDKFRRAALQHALAGEAALQGEIIPRAKLFLEEARQIQLAAHRVGAPSTEVVKLRSDAIDILMEALYLRAGPGAKALTLVATGGYGRAELCPLSDIDLLVLVPKHTQATKATTESILYPLWDIGL